MVRSTLKIVGLLLLVVGGGTGVWYYHEQTGAARKIEQLQREKEILQAVVERLGDERRVAELLVTGQDKSGDVPRTDLLFVEYARDGGSLPPRTFTVYGEMVHIDALVIKFQREFVGAGDPLRGRSIALFQRIYGDRTQPAEAPRIDEPGTIPAVYRGADPRVTEFETNLWKSFWRLVDDPGYREQMGVRVANGQGVWGPFEPGKLYTVSIESDGGLNLSAEPLKGIYVEALRLRAGATTRLSNPN
jgi:hypothetical protein